MNHSILTICCHETRIEPGAYFHLKTDWFETDQEIRTVIIDQDHTFTKMISFYPNDFVMYLEQDENGSIYRTNFPIFCLDKDDYYQVEWQ